MNLSVVLKALPLVSFELTQALKITYEALCSTTCATATALSNYNILIKITVIKIALSMKANITSF